MRKYTVWWPGGDRAKRSHAGCTLSICIGVEFFIHVAEKSVTSNCQLREGLVPHLVGDIGTWRSPCRSPEMRW